MNLDDLGHALQAQFPWAPAWLISLVVVAAALGACLGLYELLVSFVRRRIRNREAFWRSLIVRTRGPGRLVLVIAALDWALDVAPFTVGQARVIRHGLLMAVIVLCGWALLTAVDILAALYMRRFQVDVEDNLAARKHVTQLRILQRAMNTLVIVVTVGLALMTLPGVRQLGVSLLAAGGAAGIIVGLALQPILSNLMAGVQIAFTQPIRIDDAVKVEGQFGHVEEISSTYVVIKLWDLRRLVVPLKYFLEKPFENWTRDSSELIGEVKLTLDYRLPIGALRRQLMSILEVSRAWDRRIGKLQVTDASENVMVVRCLVSARNARDLVELRFEVREKMIEYLQANFFDALHRVGVEFPPAEREGQVSPPPPGGINGDRSTG